VPERVLTLTVLNTLVAVEGFKRPWSMEPFARRGVGEIYLRTLSKPAFRMLMRLQGVENMRAVRSDELDAYVDLLRIADQGRAFLRIMRGFERTAAKQRLYESVLCDARYPIQAVWGAKDPALKLSVQGEDVRRAAGSTASTSCRPSTSYRRTRRRRSLLTSRTSPGADAAPLGFLDQFRSS